VLKGEPSLEAALEAARADGAEDVLIYPLFMAGGYFVQKVLPERIAAAGLIGRSQILTPLGLDPRLPSLMLTDALAAARQAGFAVESSRLLVVGHGSKFGPASAEATRLVADRMAEASLFKEIAVAFLEEEPLVGAALASSEPTIVSGFFFGDGMHAGEDVPRAIAEANARAVYAGAIGSSPEIPALVAAALAAQLAQIRTTLHP